jgi:FAD/FMN-containing dehydrogenase
VAIRGGGHNVAGNAVCDGGIVIDLSPMKGIRVDPDRGRSRAEPGVTWGELDHETQAFGLATPGGIVSTTGIAGFTLGGGLGWLSRRWGTASDNLLSADLITADGRRLVASPDENPELYWGIRGGGGNFGVVTSFEHGLHPVGALVLGGLVFYRLAEAPGLLRLLQDFTQSSPDESLLVAVLRIAPAAPFLPAEVHGQPVIAFGFCHTGPLDQAERDLAQLRGAAAPVADLIRPLPYCELQRTLDAGQVPGFHNYWRAEYLEALSDAAIDTIIEYAAAITSPLSDIKVIPMGGAFADRSVADSAFQRPQASVLVNINARWSDPADADRHIDWTKRFWSALGPWSSGAGYVNFLGDEGADRVRAAYGQDRWKRLVALKDAYDPTNVFRFNHNIAPSPTDS